MQYSNPQVDALLDAARATSDQGQRATDYQQAQKLILQDASYVFINHGLNIQATTNNIKGFTLLPTGMRYLGGLAGQRTEPADDGHSGLCAGTGAALPFAVTVRAFPPGGYVFLCRRPGGNIRDLILPMVTLGTGAIAVNPRQIRASMIEVLNQDHVRTARAKGLEERRVQYVR